MKKKLNRIPFDKGEYENIFLIQGNNRLLSLMIIYERGVAQLGSAGALGVLGRRFESCRPD